MAGIRTFVRSILPGSLSGRLWVGIAVTLALAAILLADERLLAKRIQHGIGKEPFKLLLQFLLITVAGGAVLALVNTRKEEDARDEARRKDQDARDEARRKDEDARREARAKDEDARREARTKAIQSLSRELSEAYRSMKESRRRLRSRLVRSDPKRLHSKRDDFEACMDELLAAQIALEQVEDNIEISSGLFGTEQFNRISAALHYAARYLHDVFENFEKECVGREKDSYVIAERCRNLRDFLGEPLDDADFCDSVKELYDQYREKSRPPEKRHDVLLEIEKLRQKSERGGYRYRKIAFECIRSASRELRMASTD
jgi:hypothetical protein